MKTVMIKTANGPVIINECDYDPAIHTLAEGVVPPVNVFANPGENMEDLRARWESEVRPQIEAELRARLEPEIRAAILAEMAAAPGALDVQENAPPVDTGAVQAVRHDDQADPTPAALLVTKKGKRFAVIGADGKPAEREGIDPAGYETEQAAWDAILGLK